MAVDLTMVPWNRLAKLAPPGTSTPDLQAAADRWSLRADVYNAAADLWEEKALTIDTAPDETSSDPGDQAIKRVSQDGISVEYATDAIAGNSQSTRIAQLAQIGATVRRLRARGKPVSSAMHPAAYDPWRNDDQSEVETIILVDGV